MVRLTITPTMLKAIQYLDQVGENIRWSEERDASSSTAPSVGDPILHEKVLEISTCLHGLVGKQENESPPQLPLYHLDDLLRGSRVYVEPPAPKPEPTSEYKALMARLRREEEARAYERMINPPPPAETFAQRFSGSQTAHLFPTAQADVGEDDEISYAEVNRQMALIANVLVSIIACSVAIWMVARYWSTPARLALSMGGSALVGVAEVVVYAAYLSRLKDARAKGKKEVEVKEIIKTWVIGNEEDKASHDDSVSVASRKSPESAVRQRKPLPTT